MSRRTAASGRSDRPFRHLLAVTGLSNLSDGVLQVGVPLLALSLTRSPALVAMVSAAATLPWLLLALHAGVLVDRYDRVRILTIATAARVAVLVLAAASAAAGLLTIPLLLVLLLALGAAEVFADSAAGAVVPAIVPRERLGAANGRLLAVQQLGNAFLGAPLAGVVVGMGGIALFGLPAALFAVATVLILRGLREVGAMGGSARGVSGEALADPRPGPRRTTSMRSELAEGVRFLSRHPVLRPLVLTATVLNFSNAAYFAVFVLWVVGPGSAVGLDAALYGSLTVGLAVGALAGALVADRLRRRVGEARLLTTAWLVNTLLLLVPVLVPRVGPIAVTFLVVGFTNMVGNVVSQSMRQRLVPDRLLGRVAGVSRTLGFGSIPLGAALGGAVGQVAGLPAVFLGAVGLSLVLVVWVMRAVPQRRVDEADRASASAAASAAAAAGAARPAAVPAVA